MAHNKCNRCGSKDSKTFWSYKDDTVLCDSCNKKYGVQWQKQIGRAHGKEKSGILKKIFIVLGIIFGLIILILIIVGSLAYFGILNPSSTAKVNTSGVISNAESIKSSESCGDGECNYPDENCASCPSDCGLCHRCGDGTCDVGETCDSCSSDCGACSYCGDGKCSGSEYVGGSCPSDCGFSDTRLVRKDSGAYTFEAYKNQEPYYSGYCDKINPYDLNIRKAAAKAIRNDPGAYSVNQLFDVYDWVKENIAYQNVALFAENPYPPQETLTTESGDCKNQAVLIASMIQAIGGTAKVVVDPSCTHAYAIVRFGSKGEDLSRFSGVVANHYGSGVNVNSFTNDDGVWVIFDPAGGRYPGSTLPECSGSRTVYFIDGCLSCVNKYPNSPYTYGDSCYSECPSGTIHQNNYACSPCPAGYGSYNNQCFTCQNGLILGSDGLCHQTCGNANTYCVTGTCFNNQCITCPSGYYLATDGKCYLE